MHNKLKDHAFATLKIKNHHIILHNFPEESGKISFRLLKQLAEMLQTVAGGALRLTIEGMSSKKGPKPKWLEDSVNFQLTDIQKGSTDLMIEAPILEESLSQPQLPLFGRSPETLKKCTGIDLALESFDQAFGNNKEDDLIDKHLLKEMEKHRSLFRNSDGTVEITGDTKKKPTEISKQSFANIQKLEQQIPPSSRARITGVLDLMKYSKNLIQIQTDDGAIRALLSEEIKFKDVTKYFGKKVTLEGIANFKPSGNVRTIEVSKVRLATEDDEWFAQKPAPVKEQLDLKILRVQQDYKGTKLDKIIGQWPGDEPIEELLEILNK